MKPELTGKKVIGHWGAMIPETFGIIADVRPTGVRIVWEDMPQDFKTYDELRYDYDNPVGTPIGVYVQDES